MVLLSLLLVCSLVGWGLWHAAGHVEPFYQAAIEVDTATLAQASEELEVQATNLYSTAQRPGEWSALFTDQQINGWLATKLEDDFADILPDEVKDIRVAVESNKILLGFRVKHKKLDAVISLTAKLFLTSPDTIALQLESASLGAIPVPLDRIVQELASNHVTSKLPIQWTEQDSKPVAMFSIGPFQDGTRHIELHTIKLLEGEIYFAGQTIDIQN